VSPEQTARQITLVATRSGEARLNPKHLYLCCKKKCRLADCQNIGLEHAGTLR
jgi:hypothetical protein